MVGIVSLLVSGCATLPGLAMSDTPKDLPTPTRILSSTSTPGPIPNVPATEEEQTVTFTVVYDNNEYDTTLAAAWGFSCWAETGEATVLFDTGGDGSTLLGNLAELDLDPQAIDAVVLSHVHGDHTGGLASLLDADTKDSASSLEPPTVYVPAAFPASFKADVRARTELVEVTGPAEIVPGIYTTGQVGSSIIEQALVVETGGGLVVVTGCAHPGIVEMVRRAKEVTAGEIALVMGGFHLGGASRGQIEGIIAEFRRLGVQRMAPCHCTGDRARRMFVDAYGADCTLAGVGWMIRVGSGE
jgi:7,8-dihydropterin-6-yl-methyl-4-(beta-D-ribofuranosyl)aminobenzene 5'-phosphate synthase